MEEELLFSLGYFIVAVCLVVPPKEIASLGLTVQNLFSPYLGVEDLHFIPFHLKRTSVTILVHSLLPLGYYIFLGLASPELQLFNLQERHGLRLIAPVFLLLSLTVFISAVLIILYWSRNNWKNHPLVNTLRHHGSPWIDVAARINIEFRRIDKFSSHIGGTSIYITDAWIIKCSAYKVDIAHKPDVHLNILKAENHEISIETNSSVQFLNIQVSSINLAVKSFTIRLNSLDYSELKEKIQAPIVNARNVVIRQSLSDQFVNAFKEQVEQNQRYHIDRSTEVPESCIGCMQRESNIKLQKLCASSDVGTCIQCFCRPMWCLDCMGKWFASRQDQSTPGTWMSSTSPCPTCRATFCVLDVSLIT
ncbi:E3 ubiquitin-protein ligase TM129-like [Dendronephthya gigantea]|uniref:E3 ubiquitin-protein ligase TM129-like n=1 Tax=Dendronephthya gigantea TaxID=151771 RepID=UPI00106CA5C2|nr:E3 ubiquitin-protein ligase TM129-like [Dendronephthya gigantea]